MNARQRRRVRRILTASAVAAPEIGLDAMLAEVERIRGELVLPSYYNYEAMHLRIDGIPVFPVDVVPDAPAAPVDALMIVNIGLQIPLLY